MIDWDAKDHVVKGRHCEYWFYRKFRSGLTQWAYTAHLEDRNEGDRIFIVERSEIDPETLSAEYKKKAELYGNKWQVVERAYGENVLLGTPVSGPYTRLRDAKAALLLMIK